ncbi:MAG: hypothetical protein AABZ32_11150 [Bacteroidota bacterium]
MNLKQFQEYIAMGLAKKQSPNINRASYILAEAKSKRQFLDVALASIAPEEMNPNFLVDFCYDLIMELVRAKMLIDGFNAGNSHEAEVSYMRNLGFQETEVNFMDEVRYYRNGTKYLLNKC